MQNHKAFTLIELLVVVAIIGILAAVGVVAYNGYTKSAKIAAVKSNLDLAQKYIITQLMRCEIGDQIQMWTRGAAVNPHDGNCDTTSNRYRQNFSNTMNVLDEDPRYRNPFDSSGDQAFVQDYDPPLPSGIGRVSCGIRGSSNTIPITCYGRWGTGQNDYDTVTIANPY